MKVIEEKISDAVGQLGGEAAISLTRPEPQFGDYASNVALQLSKQLGRNPREIAEEIVVGLRETPEIAEVSIAGAGFINIRLTDTALRSLALQPLAPSRADQTVVIETNNPNPFKAMHIGHAFNAILGDTIANLLDLSGAHTYRVSYHGDVGLHVGKSMYSLLRYVDGDSTRLSDVPEAERNSFMSRMYAEGTRAYKDDAAARQEIETLARQSFTREDPVYAQIYNTVFGWSFDQIDIIVARLGNRPIAMRFLESDADVYGVKTVRDNVPRVFQKSDGALIFRGSEYGSFDNVFVGANGLGLYSARDLGLIQMKREQFHPSRSYIVTAEEQRDYFKGVIAAAAQIWPDEAGVTVNISTGTVKLTTGKMSSRDGDVIEIAWLFDQIAEAIRQRGGEASEEIVAGALRYAFLKVRIGGDVVFDINESVSITGNSGPYLQYAHARACSILQKASSPPEVSEESLDENERRLLLKMSEYSEVVDRATSELLPHYICTYLYELAQEFNRFYEKSRIIGDEREAVRLPLVGLYRETLARGLAVLGIAAPERM